MADLEPNDFVLKLEMAAEQAATRPLRAAIAEAGRLLTALWPGDDAPEFNKQVALANVTLLGIVSQIPTVLLILTEYLDEAFNMGVENALSMADPPEEAPFKRPTPVELVTMVGVASEAIRQQTAKARALLSVARTLEDARTALAVAAYGASRVAAVARTVTNTAVNEGLVTVANGRDDLVLVWRPERDACVNCLAYAGKINSGRGYPKGLTYGDKPISKDTVKRPPLHPNCRCDQIVWNPSKRTGPIDLPEALEREAKRSVLRGWKVESESEALRLRAADRLLMRGSTLPKSVKAYARRAIQKGEFPRGTSFPGAR